ncbi:MAG TPA: BatD family protein [Candidatus Latescibacteria bacterium]|nr:BatD family protein [Candidatus Latescibacterota bacterium]HJP30308.1 BatD family protein [Candidatus Latescibacterota bacterium]
MTGRVKHMQGPRVPSVVLLILSLSSTAWAGSEFHAAVDRVRATQSEAIRLTLTLSSTGSLDHVPSPTLDLSNFDVFGPSVSTRIGLVNGRSSFARELIYTLYGRKTGRFRIGPASIEVAGATLSTETIEVEIVRGGRQAKGQGATAGDGKPSLEEVIFVRAVAERDTAYVGQQVVVRFDLCYRFNLRDVGFAEIPTFTGFWVKELFVAQRLAPQREMIDGVAYDVAPLRRVALFPTSAGTHTVESLSVKCSVPQGRGRGSLLDALSMFDDPIFGRGQSMMVRSEPIVLQVLPLPEQGRPVDFAGAVGHFEVSGVAQPQQVDIGDPITLRIEIEGDGNVQSIAEPEMSPRGFEVYAPTVELEEGKTATGAYGARKKMEYILIPEQGGRRRIPAVEVSYFDPDTRRYRTATTSNFDILIEAGETEAGAAPAYDLTRREIEQLGRDIRHIKPDASNLGASRSLYRNGFYWLLHGLLPLAYVGLLAYQRHRRRLEGDEAYARRRRARGEATRRLSTAADRVDDGDGFHGALQDAVVVFIADQLNRPAPGLTRDACHRLLTERGLPDSLVAGIDRLLERCEFGRFAPGASGLDERQELLAEGEELVEHLREALS